MQRLKSRSQPPPVGPSHLGGRLKLGLGLSVAALVCASAYFHSVRLGTAGQEPDINVSEFELVFDENFDTLDVSAWGPNTRWIAHTPWGGDFGDALFVDPEPGFPFTIDYGILRIEARKGEDGLWRSGLLASSDPEGRGFHLQYGYFEMRAKLPVGPGVWPAFWLIYNSGPDTSFEIDALEYYGHAPDIFHSAVAVWPKHAGGEKQVHGIQHTVPYGHLTDAFRDYGVLVGVDEIVFYLDQKELGRLPTPKDHVGPLFILLNLALGSGWPIDQTPDPSFMYVDYVRAYRPLQE
jgi:beta-glucanase (GH16 family)